MSDDNDAKARRIFLALLGTNMLDIVEHVPPENRIGTPEFTEKEFAQARKDIRKMVRRYREGGGFLRGKILAELGFIKNVLEDK